MYRKAFTTARTNSSKLFKVIIRNTYQEALWVAESLLSVFIIPPLPKKKKKKKKKKTEVRARLQSFISKTVWIFTNKFHSVVQSFKKLMIHILLHQVKRAELI